MVDNYSLKLLEWYYENHRSLPWRETKDPYKIWISEIMLQQTQVDTVIAYYNRFIETFDTVEKLAMAGEEQVLKLWEGLGYYSRAKNLMKCAKVIVDDYQGVFPKEYDELIKLPGIGPYTAGAVMSIAFNIRQPAVDGNVMRVISRHYNITDDISLGKSKLVFEKQVKKLIPEDASSFNQALMELGALICLPKNPKCPMCPVRQTCQAFINGTQIHLPVKSKKIKQKKEKIAFAYFELEGKIIMLKGAVNGLLPGLWTLPLIEVEQWKDTEKNLGKLLNQEYGVKLSSIRLLSEAKHMFTHKIWEMKLFEVSGSIERVMETENYWIELDAVESLAKSKAIQKLLEGIK